ncbi:CoA pyrophosphatase [Patulibacter sp.]|uniref:NUDIX hydrolase n=1 Tax=Patulibacter sp. TaxID=1912859 RepID=UPI00272421E6|nr:CoA pyrophosphatase [Patulibacter sp.]MDO9408451.1 CoA pyrophosphatase [Patulibacter sp.]
MPTSPDARERIRSRLLPTEDAAELAAHGSTRAAVLVPLVELDGRIHVVLTRRRSDMRRHAGEISFPGGRSDPEDASPTATALREAHEEVGLPPENVEILGALSPVGTFVTGFAVYPVVGWVDHPGEWQLSPREVDVVLELELGALRAGYERRRLVRRGVPFTTDAYVVDDHVVWGATGRMLTDLFERLPPELVPGAPATTG